jgi:hypothetical protein
MPSTLYTAARSMLDPKDERSLAGFDRSLRRARRSQNGGPIDGARLLANLRAEAHLTGSKPFGDPAELAALLGRCAGNHRAATKSGLRVEAYLEACEAHAGRGLAIPKDHLPARLLRYSAYRAGADDIVERILGKAARMDFVAETLSAADAFAQVEKRWDASRMLPTDRLGARSVVWATFRHRKGTPRHDAKSMVEALALPPPVRSADRILIEFAYDRDAVQNHRFPTVADAGLTHQFRPAPEAAPDPAKRRTWWGRTKPTGPWPAQPEIVHDNASLQVLRRAPRFVGRFP